MNPLWRLAGVSARGAAHVRSGAVCQDACAFEELPGGLLLIAVADGAGSAQFAREGALLQVREACDFLHPRLVNGAGGVGQPRQLFEPALAHALSRVQSAAEAAGATPRDFAATMLLAIAAPDWVSCAQVGDGAVVLAGEDPAFSALTTPATGEYVNETTFLVSAGAIDQAQYAFRRQSVRFLALLSDGLQRLALTLPAGEPFAPFFARFRLFMEQVEPFEQRQAELDAFLASDHVRKRADDDLTLVLALRP